MWKQESDPDRDLTYLLDQVSKRQFQQLSAYLDDELSPVEVAEVEAWLRSDPNLQRVLSHLRSVQASFDHLPHPPAPSPTEIDDLVTDVFAALDQPARSSLPPSIPSQLEATPSRVTPIWRRYPLSQLAAGFVLLIGTSWAGWYWSHPEPIVTLDQPPVKVARLTHSQAVAERYLFDPATSEDPFTILFVEEDSHTIR